MAAASPGCAGFTPETRPAVEAASDARRPGDHTTWATAILPWTMNAGTTTKTYKFNWDFDGQP